MSTNFEARANYDITAEKIRLVLGNDSKILTLIEAMKIADIGNTDLVQINNADIPVCKLMDFAKFVYDQKQALKQNNKKQKQTAIQVKEIQLSSNTQQHDIEIKANSTKKFLEQGKHVLVCARMLMRDGKPNTKLAEEKINAFLECVGAYSIVKPIDAAGKNMSITIKQG